MPTARAGAGRAPGAASACAAAIGAVRRGAADGWEDVDGWCDATADARRRTSPVGDDDPLRLMYTCGTESRPKGAMLSQPRR